MGCSPRRLSLGPRWRCPVVPSGLRMHGSTQGYRRHFWHPGSPHSQILDHPDPTSPRTRSAALYRDDSTAWCETPRPELLVERPRRDRLDHTCYRARPKDPPRLRGSPSLDSGQPPVPQRAEATDILRQARASAHVLGATTAQRLQPEQRLLWQQGLPTTGLRRGPVW